VIWQDEAADEPALAGGHRSSRAASENFQFGLFKPPRFWQVERAILEKKLHD